MAFCASTFVSFQPIFEDEMKHINTGHYICIWASFIIITFLLTSSFQTHKQAVTFITYFLSQLLILFSPPLNYTVGVTRPSICCFRVTLRLHICYGQQLDVETLVKPCVLFLRSFNKRFSYSLETIIGR